MGTPYSLPLFDSSHDALSCLEQPELVMPALPRLLEDRVVGLKQDHRRLNDVIESKTAADAE